MLHEHGIPKEVRPKIIALTGHVEPEFQQKALASGMDSVYNKPIHVD